MNIVKQVEKGKSASHRDTTPNLQVKALRLPFDKKNFTHKILYGMHMAYMKDF